MINNATFKDKVERKLNEWKGLAEHLDLQLHLGRAEAEDAFEKQKSNLLNWSDSVAANYEKAKDISEENAEKIRASIDNLRLQAALGKADTEDILEEQQKNINQAIQRLSSDIEFVYKNRKERGEDFMEEAEERLNYYRTSFDLFKLQMYLAKEDAEEIWEEKKKETKRKIEELEYKLKEETEEASEKWEHFTKEMTHAWKHIRNAFD
ncbi:MAG: hypothetical protein KBF73_06440 [Flavobacteriales bacterium]|nr:hypothetical protein [Flavobacteriales bacterium]